MSKIGVIRDPYAPSGDVLRACGVPEGAHVLRDPRIVDTARGPSAPCRILSIHRHDRALAGLAARLDVPVPSVVTGFASLSSRGSSIAVSVLGREIGYAPLRLTPIVLAHKRAHLFRPLALAVVAYLGEESRSVWVCHDPSIVADFATYLASQHRCDPPVVAIADAINQEVCHA